MKNSVKCLSTLLIGSLLLFNCQAQMADVTETKPVITSEATVEPAVVYEQPQFPGGKAELTRFVKESLVYPVSARENNVKGTVEVTFIVDANGVISNPKVTKSIGSGCDEAALKLVAKMPHWTPGKKNGNISTIACSLPVRFDLK